MAAVLLPAQMTQELFDVYYRDRRPVIIVGTRNEGFREQTRKASACRNRRSAGQGLEVGRGSGPAGTARKLGAVFGAAPSRGPSSPLPAHVQERLLREFGDVVVTLSTANTISHKKTPIKLG